MIEEALKEYIESIIESSKVPNKEGIHIEMSDNSFWRIDLLESEADKLEIKVNGNLIGTFIKEPKDHKYFCWFQKHKKNIKKYAAESNFILRMCEGNDIPIY